MTQKECFVIMPFGEKTDGARTLDFDKIYEELIKKAAEKAGLACVRCDEIIKAGSIHDTMINHIFQADVAIVDISLLNPNVFYELGVRHALAKSVTVIIRDVASKIPFNISGFKVSHYNSQDITSYAKCKKEIVKQIKHGLDKKTDRRETDSLVYTILPDLKVERDPIPITETKKTIYTLKSDENKHIGFITGEIRHIHDIDIWVNSENTNMQMARHYDLSISGIIRYAGAKKHKDKKDVVIADTIAMELAKVAPGNPAHVPAGAIRVTGPGELKHTNKVKKIFHAAAVHGMPAIGYKPIDDVGECVRNALELAASPLYAKLKFKSILFPLMGTGTARGSLEEGANKLIEAAISCLESSKNSPIENVFFIARTERDKEVCQHILDHSSKLISKQRKTATKVSP